MVGVSFVREMWEPEGLPQPLQRARVITNDQVYMDYANVGSVLIGGPYTKSEGSRAAAKDTPSRRAIFVCQPKAAADARGCASKILSRLARLAYRRPVTGPDVSTLLDFFESGRRDGGDFDAGIQFALERALVDPDFLLRVYRDPAVARGTAPAQSYPLSDLEVASRLSFFLWNSIPDDKLLDLAERKQLTKPDVLEQQTRRMLADPRGTRALVDNFGAQWLNLRRVREVIFHPDIYPDFDDSLLEAFEQETKLFLASTLHEDRSVRDLLNANYTFVNERLARHYRIPGIYGSRFRRVTLPNLDQRGGLLGNGAILATTSYPERTSPVLRGKWLLENILGTPPPPPPPDVPGLPEQGPGGTRASVRERLEQHRKNPTCAACHAPMDPLGFALEHYDAVGAWRTTGEGGAPVDANGRLPDGGTIDGLKGLRSLLMSRPEQFAGTVTEKLLSYALGRGLEYPDMPVVRRIVADSASSGYRWSSLITGIVNSAPFQMRMSRAEPAVRVPAE
jgi:hypothetical protein